MTYLLTLMKGLRIMGINFMMRITKSMKVLIHWVQYFYRTSVDPTIIDFNEVVFIQQLETTMYRAETTKKKIYQSRTRSKEASPVPLESESKWKEWGPNFIKYMSTLSRVNVISCLMCCTNFSIHVQKVTSPNLLTR